VAPLISGDTDLPSNRRHNRWRGPPSPKCSLSPTLLRCRTSPSRRAWFLTGSRPTRRAPPAGPSSAASCPSIRG